MYGDPSGCIIVVTRASRHHKFSPSFWVGSISHQWAGALFPPPGSRPALSLSEDPRASAIAVVSRRNVAVERSSALADGNVSVDWGVLPLSTSDGWFEKSLKWMI